MLEIQDLHKYYGKAPKRYAALNGLNLRIEKGELFGFVGPNGAGKTTTMRIIAGLLQADSGSVHLEGVDISKNPKYLREKIGYMPDFFGVYDNLKTMEYMEFYASIYGIYGTKARQQSYELLEMVSLQDKVDQYVDGLSRGMKQRLCLARCLIHNPSLLILDEPASGLDPKARMEMKNILRNINGLGKSIIISSHILPELSQTCTTIGVIQKGKMVVKGTVEEIQHQMKTSNPLLIRTVEGQEQAVKVLKKNPMVENIAMKGNEISFGFMGDEREEAGLLASLVGREVGVAFFGRQEGSLESLFLELTEKERVRGQED